MSDREIRQEASQKFVGVSVAIGLLVEALRAGIEPSALSEGETAESHRVFGMMHQAGERMAQFALRLRQGDYHG
jgi:hypothetical protein